MPAGNNNNAKSNNASFGIKIEDIGYSFSWFFEKKLKEMPQNFTALLLTNAADYNNVVLGIAEVLLGKKKQQIVYLTANKQSKMLVQMFSEAVKDFNPKNVFFLDCVSKGSAKNSERVAECTPQNLIDLNISLNQALDTIPQGGFLIVDSISTIAIYHDEKILKKFVKTIVEKCYTRKVNGIFICGKSDSMRELIEDIAQFFDATIDAEKL